MTNKLHKLDDSDLEMVQGGVDRAGGLALPARFALGRLVEWKRTIQGRRCEIGD